MAINLQKGQRVDLTKGNPGLSKIMVGLGWDPVQKSGGGGLFGGLFGGGGSGANVDCDASVIMLGANDKLQNNNDVVYFGNLKSKDGSIIHSGDNLTGDGDGDDEQVSIELNRVPSQVEKLVFVVNIYDAVKRKQHFGMIRNAFIRVVNPSNNQELIKYNLTDDYSGKTSLIVGELYRHGNEWKFAAVGTGTNASGLSEVVRSYT
jgi:stress response protein SCP2